MLKFIATRFGHDVNDNNIADAIGLGYVGMALVGDWSPTMEAQSSVLATIRKNNPILSRLDKRDVAVEW